MAKGKTTYYVVECIFNGRYIARDPTWVGRYADRLEEAKVYRNLAEACEASSKISERPVSLNFLFGLDDL